MTFEIGMLLYPRLTQLDLTAPFELFHRVPDARVHLVWKDTRPVRADSGMTIVPTTSMDDCPKLDLLCVPGGPVKRSTAPTRSCWHFSRSKGARRST
jgi:cyclohexyl-isocyanide hydratase